jgi:hypothetical protein
VSDGAAAARATDANDSIASQPADSSPAAEVDDSGGAQVASSSTPARRPSYVWAQNGTHAFVTVSLSAAERRVEPLVDFGQRDVRVRVPPPSTADEAVALRVEMYRQLQPTGCEWQLTNRGLLLRLRKRTSSHWPRLLRSGAPDGRQGVDWTRWAHPEAERAERRESARDEFAQLSVARETQMRELRPKFEHKLQRWRAAFEADDALEPAEQVEMVRLGESILRLFRAEREERARLLGDAPLPAGVDEEKLERALIQLREYERQGTLKYNRNEPSWREWRRRQTKKRTTLGLDPQTGQPVTAAGRGLAESVRSGAVDAKAFGGSFGEPL